MVYIPNTDDDRRLMLEKIGVASLEDLLAPIPDKLRLKQPLDLPEPLSEMELFRQMKALALKNADYLTVFAGGGVYDHYVPAVVEALAGRPEFQTAYTPYQAEVSQGTLQAIYEFQSHICRLTGMDAANASMYDGASAVAEAALLSMNKTRRAGIVVSDAVSPLYRQVLATYLAGKEVEITIVPHSEGQTDFDRIGEVVNDDTACLILAQPNFFGLIEDIEQGGQLIHKTGGHLIVAADPIAAAVLTPPGEVGADITVGEGQPLGLPLNFGGPLLGFFAVKKELIRLLPGRLAARTEDVDGRPGFVLTLQTREQHIRRDRATSNICTNQALCATMAAIYMSLLGRQGLRQVALLSLDRAHRAAEKIFSRPEYEPWFEGAFVREMVVRTPGPAAELIEHFVEKYGLLAGIDLGRYYPDMENALLIAFTEKRTESEIDKLSDSFRKYASHAVLP